VVYLAIRETRANRGTMFGPSSLGTACKESIGRYLRSMPKKEAKKSGQKGAKIAVFRAKLPYR